MERSARKQGEITAMERKGRVTEELEKRVIEGSSVIRYLQAVTASQTKRCKYLVCGCS